LAQAAEALQLGPWPGGVRYDIPVEEVAAHELSSMENVRIGTGGQAESRMGTLSYESVAAIAGTPTLTMAAEYMVDATTTQVVIVAGAVIYYYNSGWTDITGTVTATAGDDNTWEWINANGTLVATNGVDTNAFKYTGTGNASDLDDDARFTKGKHIEWFDNRAWIGNVNGATNQVWYSDTADIETWGDTSFFNFDGIIQGLRAAQNYISVHTTTGIYVLRPTGNASLPYSSQKLTSEAGLDGRSIVAIPGDKQYMVRRDGIYSWWGNAELTKVSDQLDGGYWPNLNKARLHKSHATYYPQENEIWFFLPHGAAQTNMNHVMVFNILSETWYGPYKGWERNCSTLIDDVVHAGDFGGFLWDHDEGDDDNGTAIAATFQTGAPAAIAPDVRTRFLNARHYYDAKGSYTIEISQQSADLVGTSANLPLKGTGFTLDEDLLDNGITLSEIRQESAGTKLSGYAPQCSLQYTMNAADQSFIIRKAILRHRPVGRFNKPNPV